MSKGNNPSLRFDPSDWHIFKSKTTTIMILACVNRKNNEYVLIVDHKGEGLEIANLAVTRKVVIPRYINTGRMSTLIKLMGSIVEISSNW